MPSRPAMFLLPTGTPGGDVLLDDRAQDQPPGAASGRTRRPGSAASGTSSSCSRVLHQLVQDRVLDEAPLAGERDLGPVARPAGRPRAGARAPPGGRAGRPRRAASAPLQPQAEHPALAPAVVGVERLAGARRLAPAAAAAPGSPSRPGALRQRRPATVLTAPTPMPEVVGRAPVGQAVAALVAGAGEVGRLVPAVAGRPRGPRRCAGRRRRDSSSSTAAVPLPRAAREPGFISSSYQETWSGPSARASAMSASRSAGVCPGTPNSRSIAMSSNPAARAQPNGVAGLLRRRRAVEGGQQVGPERLDARARAGRRPSRRSAAQRRPVNRLGVGLDAHLGALGQVRPDAPPSAGASRRGRISVGVPPPR